MTKEETIKIMAMLNAFYAGGKNDPKMQATAWHLVLQKYDYKAAQEAIVLFAENDTREYATFPAVGKIVEKIKDIQIGRDQPIHEILFCIQSGSTYEGITPRSKALISEDEYNEWLRIDAVEFAEDIEKYKNVLKRRRDGETEPDIIVVSNKKMLPMKRKSL